MATKLMKVTDVANVLNISRSLAYSMVSKGDIPSFKVGKIVRVHPEVLKSIHSGQSFQKHWFTRGLGTLVNTIQNSQY